MAPALQNPEDIELLRSRRNSEEADTDEELDLHDALLDDPIESQRGPKHSSRPQVGPFSWPSALLAYLKLTPRRRHTAYSGTDRRCLRRRGVRQICYLFLFFAALTVSLIVLASLIRPSYTTLPPHYLKLRSIYDSTGLANLNNETIFIAANIIDEDLIRGAWGSRVLDLIAILGPSNVFLSIYENDSGLGVTAALRELETDVSALHCNTSIVSEHLPLESIPTVTLPSGVQRIKRVAYLAQVRNNALRPLHDPSSIAHTIVFDKLLFLNDVIFDPLDAAQLLFSTNIDHATGRASYKAACALDFINPFKFYDTFASRDLEGYSMGLPFYPFFTTAGHGYSRHDVLAERDAVRVRSCWGGMVAFNASYLSDLAASPHSPSFSQRDEVDGHKNLNWHLDPTIKPTMISSIASSAHSTAPIQFRASTDLFWDASECCLIHADLQPRLPSPATPPASLADPQPEPQSEIFMNPFIRVAYHESHHRWLSLTRRWERLYSLPHLLINQLVGLPWHNPRREETIGETVQERVWNIQEGRYELVERPADVGGFCGVRKLSVLKSEEERAKGGKPWEDLPVPPL